MARSNVVKFPTARIVRARYPIDDGSELAAVDRAHRSAYLARIAIERQYRSLTRRMWAMIGVKPTAKLQKWSMEFEAGETGGEPSPGPQTRDAGLRPSRGVVREILQAALARLDAESGHDGDAA